MRAMRFGTHAIAVLGAVVLAAGCRAAPRGRWETAVATKAKHWVFVRNKAARNPVSPTPENIADGKATFSHYCVACHGLDGQNTGVPFADNMAPAVPSLASTNVQSYTDGQLKWVIDNGIFPSGMPASKGILTDEEIWSIVVYIRNLPPAGSLGEPTMYSGEDGDAPAKDSAQER